MMIPLASGGLRDYEGLLFSRRRKITLTVGDLLPKTVKSKSPKVRDYFDFSIIQKRRIF